MNMGQVQYTVSRQDVTIIYVVDSRRGPWWIVLVGSILAGYNGFLVSAGRP